MFYKLELSKTLDLPPRFFGPRLREVIEKKLKSEVEGTCDRKSGYIICVNAVSDVSRGVIRKDGTGFATFHVLYSCIVLRPFKGEVVDCTVTNVINHGFIAYAGPMQVFVSTHLLPGTFELQTAEETMFVSADGEDQIKEGAQVRVRLLGIKIEANNYVALGTVKEDYLGVIRKQ